ncbi:MAG: 3-oxoacyl-ACP synthase [Bacteroidetes bacterium]|nr:MAG: 3-oxoacyl-ACP synthase [Bacteroidota bacterium]
MDKSLLLETLISLNLEKLEQFNRDQEELRENLASNQKSSAGDKHETSRAMAQLEMEKLGHMIQEREQQLNILRKIKESKTSTIQAGPGSIIRTNHALFMLAIPWGKLSFEGKEILVTSLQSPIGKLLRGRKPGEEFQWNQKTYQILELF